MVWGGAGSGLVSMACGGAVRSGATTAGSMRSTAYPAPAPAPKPGVNTRVGVENTPSRTVSWIARGMLAAEVLPTRAMLKYMRSRPMPALLGEVDDHLLVRLVRDDEVDGVDEGSRPVGGMRQGLQLEIALHERLDLGPVDGDVAAELEVRPDDRVRLALGTTGVGLQHDQRHRRRRPGSGPRREPRRRRRRSCGTCARCPPCRRTSRRTPAGSDGGPPAGFARRWRGRRGSRRRRRRGRPRCGSGTCRAGPRATWRPTAGVGCSCRCRR